MSYHVWTSALNKWEGNFSIQRSVFAWKYTFLYGHLLQNTTSLFIYSECLLPLDKSKIKYKSLEIEFRKCQLLLFTFINQPVIYRLPPLCESYLNEEKKKAGI